MQTTPSANTPAGTPAGTPDLASLAQRVSQLEARSRTWRTVACAALLAGVLPWALGARATDTPQDLTVRSLVLVDQNGVEVGALRMDAGVPVLRLAHDGRHVALSLASDATGLSCGGPLGVVFAGVSDTGAYFNARGADLLGGIYAGVDPSEGPLMRTYASDMARTATVSTSATGALLTLTDAKGESVTIPAQPAGN